MTTGSRLEAGRRLWDPGPAGNRDGAALGENQLTGPRNAGMVKAVRDEEQLDRATVLAAKARGFAAFRRELAKLTAAQEQPTRRRR